MTSSTCFSARSALWSASVTLCSRSCIWNGDGRAWDESWRIPHVWRSQANAEFLRFHFTLKTLKPLERRQKRWDGWGTIPGGGPGDHKQEKGGNKIAVCSMERCQQQARNAWNHFRSWKMRGYRKTSQEGGFYHLLSDLPVKQILISLDKEEYI